jgi:hypothetical protein
MVHEILQLKSVHETKDRRYFHGAKVRKTLYILHEASEGLKNIVKMTTVLTHYSHVEN